MSSDQTGADTQAGLNEDEVRRLAASIKTLAGTAADEHETVAESWRLFTDEALRAAGIDDLDVGQFDLAWKAMWRCAFYGGNFTLDARRVLRAARFGEMP